MTDNKQEVQNEPEKEMTTGEGSQEDNVVFIGTKPFMNYLTSVIMQFTIKKRGEVTIKARGKFINKAVDVAEVVRRRFQGEQEIGVGDIKIDSEEFKDSKGKDIKVSTIEITLKKK